MRTPFVAGHLKPMTTPEDATNAQELQAVLVRERINHKNELRRLADQHAAKVRVLEMRITREIADKYNALQRQRWSMAALCFAFLLIGIILGDALAPYDLR